MAIYKTKELRGMGKEEIDDKLQQLKTELSKERGAIASGTKAENPGKVKEIRKTIARILTIKKEVKTKK